VKTGMLLHTDNSHLFSIHQIQLNTGSLYLKIKFLFELKTITNKQIFTSSYPWKRFIIV